VRHKWVTARGKAYCCSRNVDTHGVAPFGISCGKNAAVWCPERHGGPVFQICGEARCRKHTPKWRAATQTRGR